MNKTMTNAQMRKRIREINKERDKLTEEKRKYEEYLHDLEAQEKLNKRKECIGKYYVADNSKKNRESYIKAFKVLSVLDDPNEAYASCLALVDGYRNTCWKEYGIQIMVIDLWYPNNLRAAAGELNPELIDLYTEVTQEEFEKLYLEFAHTMEVENLPGVCRN